MITDASLNKFDRLIKQAKDFLNEKNKRNEILKKIEIEAADILSGITTRKDEIKGLLGNLSAQDDSEIIKKLSESLAELDYMERNSIIFAEKKWVQDIMIKEKERIWSEQIQQRKDYVDREVARLKSELHEIRGFFEIAEFVNQVWAEQDLLQEFNRLDEIMRVLVDRMNDTNQKSLVTNLSKNTLKTLEHIRLNIFKSNCWTDEEIADYQSARNREIKKHRPLVVGGQNRKVKLSIIGGAQELHDLIISEFQLPVNLVTRWEDPSQNLSSPALLERLKQSDIVIIATYFEKTEIFVQLFELLKNNQIEYVLISSLNLEMVFKAIEERLSLIK